MTAGLRCGAEHIVRQSRCAFCCFSLTQRWLLLLLWQVMQTTTQALAVADKQRDNIAKGISQGLLKWESVRVERG